MKKFSNISGFKVNEEPKIEQKSDESDLFKTRVLELMDQILSVRTYGPVDRYQRAGNIKIAGKELLAEALIDLLKQESVKDKTKLLESLKSEIKDWQVLDEKIDSINNENIPSLSNVNKISSMVSKYDDLDLLVTISERNSSKINKVDTLEDYKLIISESKLPKQTKEKLIEIYDNRIKQLTSAE
jgi:hypothetical protein